MLFDETLQGQAIELIWLIYFYSRKKIDVHLKKVDLTYPQFGTLVALSKKENISQKKLADIFDIDTTNMMVVCDSLEKKKLIERKSNPKDRRENLIIRTEKGKERFREAMSLMENYAEQVTGPLDKKELKTIIPTLQKMYSTLHERKK